MSNRSFDRPVRGVDRISELPEALIVHILSLLPTTKDRIRTGVFSRRWKDLWTCVPNLDLEFDLDLDLDLDLEFNDYEGAIDSQVGDFVNRVDKTLERILSSSKVKKFRVQMPYLDYFRIEVNHWVSFAERNETEEFELDFEPHGYVRLSYDLPSNIYENPYFRQLRFNYCDFVYCKTVSWAALKKLTIESCFFYEEALEKIVAGTPALEFLNLQLRQGISKLDFSNSVVLKKLVLDIQVGDSSEKEEAAYEFTAPSVESLKVSGHFRTCKLVDMASLVEATLFGMPVIRESGYPILTEEVVSSLLNVKTLTVGTWVIQGIAKLPTRPLFLKCKCLTVDTHLWNEDPSAIARLLKSTPQVETLIVTLSEFDSRHKFHKVNPSIHGNSNIDQYWTSQDMDDAKHLTSLRTVKFIRFLAYRTVAFPFLQFLLKNARGLLQVDINFETEGYGRVVTPTQEVLETSRKLLSFPRLSPGGEITVLPMSRIRWMLK